MLSCPGRNRRKTSELRWADTQLVFRLLVDKLLQVASEIHILFIIREARLEGEHIISEGRAGVGDLSPLSL